MTTNIHILGNYTLLPDDQKTVENLEKIIEDRRALPREPRYSLPSLVVVLHEDDPLWNSKPVRTICSWGIILNISVVLICRSKKSMHPEVRVSDDHVIQQKIRRHPAW